MEKNKDQERTQYGEEKKKKEAFKYIINKEPVKQK